MSGTSLTAVNLKANGFINPFSTSGVSGITATLKTSASVTKESYTTASLTTLVPETLTAATITSDSTKQTVGQSGTTITISITTKSKLPADGKLAVKFPYWNANSPNPNQHMVESLSPNCVGTVNIASSPVCSYNQDSLLLTLTSIVSSEQAAGTTFTFTVDNIKNPIST